MVLFRGALPNSHEAPMRFSSGPHRTTLPSLALGPTAGAEGVVDVDIVAVVDAFKAIVVVVGASVALSGAVVAGATEVVFEATVEVVGASVAFPGAVVVGATEVVFVDSVVVLSAEGASVVIGPAAVVLLPPAGGDEAVHQAPPHVLHCSSLCAHQPSA